jgi:hypothetical protein
LLNKVRKVGGLVRFNTFFKPMSYEAFSSKFYFASIECTIQNATVTTTVFVSFVNITETSQTSFFFSVWLSGRTYRTALQQMKMPNTFNKTRTYIFYCASCGFVKCFLVSTGSSQYCVSAPPSFADYLKISFININIENSYLEYTCFLLVNTLCPRLHSFCATGVSRGLATTVNLTRMAREESRDGLLHDGEPVLDLIFVP